ncbi:amino acid-binding ACT domain protein [uncultured Corynebacterium sp.]|uniref:amino acid-binding ACT domain protein n=1 Tax=uncultured Corynebacterium sp. TaxID=159447 RepID=UPI00259B6B07|nr:amino acid-binding ACT domain protein [uncultured Corynebacterium sp.]
MSYLIRVSLPDVPGSLGQLAEAFGMVDADINSVDIVETSTDGTVTDDIVVTLPTGVMVDTLITAVAAVDGAEVDSIRPFTGRVDRRGQIEMLARIAQRTGKLNDTLDELVRVMPGAVTSSWAVVLRNSDGELSRAAASPAAPEDDGTRPQMPPIDAARILQSDFDGWAPEPWFQLGTALTITPLQGTDLVLVVGRVGGPDFLASEVREIGDLGCIMGAMLR